MEVTELNGRILVIKCLLVLVVLIVACTAYAEDDTPEPSQCSGMARTLKLPDEKVFGSLQL